MGKKLRTAVVFVHGQGEHTPMASAPELARTAWASDAASGEETRVRIAPDTDIPAGETPAASGIGPDGERVQFFEFYWSHLMTGNQLGHVWNWFRTMLQKDRTQTPKRLVGIRQGFIRIAEAGVVFAAAYAFLVASLFIWANGGFQAATAGGDGALSQTSPTYQAPWDYYTNDELEWAFTPDEIAGFGGVEALPPRLNYSGAIDPRYNCEHRLTNALLNMGCGYDATPMGSELRALEERSQALYVEGTRLLEVAQGQSAETYLEFSEYVYALGLVQPNADEEIADLNIPGTPTYRAPRTDEEAESADFRRQWDDRYFYEDYYVLHANMTPSLKASLRDIVDEYQNVDLAKEAFQQEQLVKAAFTFALPLLVLISFIVLLVYEASGRPTGPKKVETVFKRVRATILAVTVRALVILATLALLGLLGFITFSTFETGFEGAGTVWRRVDFTLTIVALVVAFMVCFVIASLVLALRWVLRLLGVAEALGAFTKSARGPIIFLLLAVVLPLLVVVTAEYASGTDPRLFVTQALIVLGVGAIIALWTRWLVMALILAGLAIPLAVIAAASGLDLMGLLYGNPGQEIWMPVAGANGEPPAMSYVVPGWAPPFVAETYAVILAYFLVWAYISLAVDRIGPRILWMISVSVLVTGGIYLIGHIYPQLVILLMETVLAVWTVLALLAFVGVAMMFWTASNSFLVPTMADTARYLSPRPGNIERRRAIIEEGVKLLDGLHSSGRFDRIVLVAHSLGSILTLDLLARYWARRGSEPTAGEAGEAYNRVEAAGAKLNALGPVRAEAAAQRLEVAFEALAQRSLTDSPIDPNLTPEARVVAAHGHAGDMLALLAKRMQPGLFGARASKRANADADAILPPGAARAEAAALFQTVAQRLEAGPGAYHDIADQLQAAAGLVRRAAGLEAQALADESDAIKGSKARAAAAAEALSAAATDYREAFDAFRTFRLAQRAFADALRLGSNGARPWLITDLVTIGSPLTYADYLTAQDADAFAKAKARGDAPQCPAAPGALASGLFTAVRWTNLYFVTRGIMKGDIVGGRVWPGFGLGVADNPLDDEKPNGALFAHNEYWKCALETDALAAAGDAVPGHVRQMRRALCLTEDPDLA